jgi:hypothetical protein
MNNRTTYTLKVPIVWGSESITELKFKQLKLKHMRAVPDGASTLDTMAILVEKLCDITPVQVDDIDPADFEGISQVIATFLPNAPKTLSNS